MINSQHVVLEHPVFHEISIDTYKRVRGGTNRKNSMLSLHCEDNTWWEKLQWIFSTFMLEPFSLLNSLGSWCTDEIYPTLKLYI